jgi:hypothetical protein
MLMIYSLTSLRRESEMTVITLGPGLTEEEKEKIREGARLVRQAKLDQAKRQGARQINRKERRRMVSLGMMKPLKANKVKPAEPKITVTQLSDMPDSDAEAIFQASLDNQEKESDVVTFRAPSWTPDELAEMAIRTVTSGKIADHVESE